MHFEISQLEKEIQEDFQAFTNTENLSCDQFSLGLEVFRNCNGKKFLSIFVTFINVEEALLNSQLLTIVNLDNSQNLEDIFHIVDLKNCTAVVLASDDFEEDLELFFSIKNIPLVRCFQSILKLIVSRVFQMEEVSF